MHDHTPSVSIERNLVTIEARYLARVVESVGDVLDVMPLRFSLSVPILTTPAARAGSNKVMLALKRIKRDVTAVVDGANDAMDEEINELAQAIRKLLSKHGGAAAKSHQQAAKLLRSVLARVHRVVDGLAPRIRETIGKLMNDTEFKACFMKQTLTTVGTWGFPSGQGIRVRPGLMADVPDEDESGDHLWDDLMSVRSGHRKFVLVAVNALGLAIGRSIGSDEKRRAREMAGGSGRLLCGDVSRSAGVYIFQLDKPSSPAMCEKLGKRVRLRVKNLCEKSIKVHFSDDDMK